MATHLLPHIAEAESALHTDLARLQGTWVSSAGRRVAELLVAGRLFTFRYKGGDMYMGAFWLDPSRAPRAMDMRIDEGPAMHRGKVALCIYAVDGDELHWCPTEPGTTQRLSDFPVLDDPKYLSLVFRRA
ncbi:MAG TPA: hypothetical protein VMS17_20880 [Gemmataceae bacterium]|nr:hypothetical protein [Gemmataceae bacterium]